MIKRFLSSLLFFIARLISYLPLNWLYGISKFLSFILLNIVGYRRNVIIQNLSRSFPNLKYKEIIALADDFYLHFTDVFAEVIKSISMPADELKKRFRVENPELLMEYHNSGKNIIGLTGHIGNWEWLSIVPALYPFSCYTLYKPLRNKQAEGVMTRIRLRFGMKLLAMSNAARYILSNKTSTALYIFIGDQSPAKVENAHEFMFLNQSTTFFTGGAKLARATKAAVVYISIRKVSRGNYSVRFIPIEIVEPESITKLHTESDITANASAPDNASVNASTNAPDNAPAKAPANSSMDYEIKILREYARLLEADVHATPVNWLWSHKRWKH